jgi:hypothetical protein
MTWDGAGTFNRVHNFSADASANIQAQADRFDAEFDGIATGLENCLTKTGETTPSGNQPMGGYRHTAVGAASSADNYLRADQYLQQTAIFLRGVGSTSAFGQTNVSVSAPIWGSSASPQDGTRLCFIPEVNSSGTALPKISINNGPQTQMLGVDGRPLQYHYFTSGSPVDVVFNASTSAFHVMSPPTHHEVVPSTVQAQSSGVGVAGEAAASSFKLAKYGLHVWGKLMATASVSMSLSADYLRFFVNSPYYATSGTQFLGMAYVNNGGDFKPCNITATTTEWQVRPIDGSIMSGTAALLLPFSISYLDEKD